MRVREIEREKKERQGRRVAAGILGERWKGALGMKRQTVLQFSTAPVH